MIRPPRIELAAGLEISRIVSGLWQVADQERDGRKLDREAAARDMRAYADAGYDSFDMADHYGGAELIAGRFLADAHPASSRVFTKWCPAPGPMSREIVRAGIAQRRERLGVSTIDLLQFHWWLFRYPGWLDALDELALLKREGWIRHLGVTNFDSDHLHLAVARGAPIVSNQVCFSLLDRRPAGDMAKLCRAHGIKLLTYGTLAGGFLTDCWLGKPEPDSAVLPDWSSMKYKRFIDAAGGWARYQNLLRACDSIARKHGVTIANVATRWVLDHRHVAATIVGVRLTEREHRESNLKTFAFTFDTADRALLDDALAGLAAIPGDCGDEYRRPPFLTATGDLSHHLDGLPKLYDAVAMPGRPGRTRIDSGSIWEKVCGFSRAMRAGNRILVCGTTATHHDGSSVVPGDVRGQTVYILDKIEAAIHSLGGSLEDIVRTRIYMRDATRWEEASRVHGRALGHVRPANTLVEIANLVGPYEIEIEAEAELA